MAKGFGKGNCFYLGVVFDDAAGKHRFRCTDTGALAKGATPTISFQYTIGNVGKTYTLGNAGSTNNIVV